MEPKFFSELTEKQKKLMEQHKTEIATEFEVDDYTVLRWAAGTVRPHPKIQVLVMEWLDNLENTIS